MASILFIVGSTVAIGFALLAGFVVNFIFSSPPAEGIKGHVYLLKKHDYEMFNALQEVSNTYGPVSAVRIFVFPMVITTDLELAKTIWMTKNYPKGTTMQRLQSVLGKGLAMISGDEWKRHRRIMQPGFAPSQLRQMTGQFQTHSNLLCELWEKQRVTNGAEGVEVMETMTKVTLDIISSVALRYPLNTLNGENHFAEKCWGEVLSCLATKPMAIFPLGGYVVRHIMCRKEFQEIDRILESSIDDPPVEGAEPRDLLDLMISCMKSHNENERLSRRDVHDELLIFFLAGHETTAVTMSWTMHELSHHPDIQQRLIDEVDTVLRGGECTQDLAGKLTYMTQVFREILRLHSPVTGIGRLTTEDVTAGGYVIPAGTNVMVNIEGIHHNPDIYPNPYEFNPENFSDDKLGKRHPMAFVPFTHGPRICIGQHFFMLEAKIMLARILQQFTFTAVPGHKIIKTTKSGTAKPKFGVKLLFTPRL